MTLCPVMRVFVLCVQCMKTFFFLHLIQGYKSFLQIAVAFRRKILIYTYKKDVFTETVCAILFFSMKIISWVAKCKMLILHRKN